MVLVKSVEVDIGVKGDAEAKAKLDSISARADELKRTFPAFALKIDSAAASEKIRVFRAQLADVTKDRTANIKVKVDDSQLQKLTDKLKGAGGPGWLGPAVLALPALGTLTGVVAGAAAGLAGAFTAAGGAVVAFGAVAKPVLTDAKTAATAVEKAQNNYAVAIAAGTKQSVAYKAEQIAIGKAYAELSPAQIALSKQLGAMANAWQAVKAAQTPVVAGALQPWLKSVTDLTSKLGPVIAQVSPVIRGLGVQFDALVNSAAFKGFRDFIANTGSKATGAIGSTLIDFVKAFMILLPKFNPLIMQTVGGIGALGPAVLKWASSQKTADDITRFMAWFKTNGPAVGGFLTNVGGALKALAPGLTSGGALELKVMSDFFGWVAKLPKDIAKPLAEVAGALLILNKLGVFSVGVKFVGLAAGWITKLLGGATVEVGAAGMQKAGTTMVTAAGLMQKAADTMVGGAVKGGAAGAGEGAAGLSVISKASIAAGAGLIAAGFILEFRKDLKAGWTAVLQDGAKMISGLGGVMSVSASGVASLVTGKLAGPFRTAMDQLGHLIASAVAPVWDAAFKNMAGAVLQFGIVIAQGTKAITGVFLNMVQVILNGAVKAFGWIPGLGGKLRGAAADFSTWRTGVNSDFDRVIAKMQAWQNGLNTAKNTAASATQSIGSNISGMGALANTAGGKVNALNQALTRLPKNTAVNLTETGVGNFTITQGTSGHAGGTPTGGRPGAAAGLYVATGTTPTADDVLIRASRGELVVPAHMVSAGVVDHLRGLIPGFASGGSIGALAGQTAGFHDRFIAAVTAAMEKAMTAAMRTAVAAATVAAAAVAGAMGSGGVSNASGVAALKSAAAKHGWTSAAEWAALNYVEMREAGYSLTATNPTSGAYGMAQFINGPSEYAQYGGNSTTYAGQATAMANYIAQRYGDPIAAAAHERAFNWYGGGLDAIFRRPTLIGVGEAGPERVQVTPGHGGGGDLVAELRALRAELRQLTGVAAAIPRATGQHVGDAIGGAAAGGSFGRRYH